MGKEALPSTDLLQNVGRVRTDLHCTECGKGFVAELDYDIDGNHVVECPYCTHEHCRVIEKGRVTGDRWDHRAQRIKIEKHRVWTHDVLQMKTATASEFIRQKWLDRIA